MNVPTTNNQTLQVQADMCAQRPAVLFASAEVAPFSKTGGLGDVAGSLPRALNACGCRVSVITPKYRFIAPEWTSAMSHVNDMQVEFGVHTYQCGIDVLTFKGVDCYFLDCAQFFNCDACYAGDEGTRFAFFSKAVCDCVCALNSCVEGFACDVIHCNDWHTALVPAFLKQMRDLHDDAVLQNVRTVLTIHNACFQGPECNFTHDYLTGLEIGQVSGNYMQVGLQLSDYVTTVSPHYACELQTVEYGSGLENYFRALSEQGRLAGVLNGLDFEEWNPETDAVIDAAFSANDLSGKATCKAIIQQACGLEVNATRPLLVMIGRLSEQKGFDLVIECLPSLVEQGVQVVILGTGDSNFAQQLNVRAAASPQSVCFMDKFDEAMAHRLYAAGDMFLMPSRFEPCGLAQLIAMRYGALPVVRDTGGLHDTVQAFDASGDLGTGFVFAAADAVSLYNSIQVAINVYRNQPDVWRAMQIRAMQTQFDWVHSALEYKQIYMK